MADLATVQQLVSEFESNFRGQGLEPFIYVKPYMLGCGDCWPEITTTRKGIYAIFSNDTLLYIGKVTGRTRVICHRLNDHFIVPSDFSYGGAKGIWSKEPTHFVAWGVPDASFFEASALEEFLIDRLKGELPDNSRK
ncbi:hypothetical protein [Paraglaciecola sp. L3A3]|uniref:hypothetical protein n=1 Tax=Paraglaciecola sp. L3A3 TaxID=2686358 RepID=UPI00131AE9EF|nr:hypothetical protein [Paraglaciecola sp. L3A3]